MIHVKLNLDYTTNPSSVPGYTEAINAGGVIQAELVEVAAVPGGMASGKPLAMFQTINAGLRGRYGEMP